MITKTAMSTRFIGNASIALLILLFILLLTILHDGLYPNVFADEWIYSLSARLQPLSASVSPSYLYLLLFKTTNYCGPDFLSCARILNACFFTLASPFIYRVASRVTTHKIALFITVLSLSGPINSYTAYFMPESLYFFSFWVFTWFALTKLQKSPLFYGSGLGLIFCIMTLIKVHAVFLMPAIFIFLFLLLLYKPIDISLNKIMFSILYMLIVFICTRELLGYILAGQNGLDVLGIKYHYNAVSLFNTKRLHDALLLLIIPVLGHLSALVLFFAVPLAILTNIFQRKSIDSVTAINPNIITGLFLISCLISLFFITTITTTQIVGWDPYETINRIHLRYYNFIFPLFFIIAAGGLSTTTSVKSFGCKHYLTFILICFAFFYASLYLRGYYSISYIDCPELFGLLYNNMVFKCLSILGMLCLITWTFNKKWGSVSYVFIFLPLSLIISNYYVHIELRKERLHFTDAYDKAGLFTRDYLGHETSHLVVIGSERGGLFKTLFYLDNPKTNISELPTNTPIEFAKIPADTDWVLFIGEYPILRKPLQQISMGDFTLIRIK